MADDDEVTEVVDFDDDEVEVEDEGEDLKLTVTLTWKEEPGRYDLPGVKSRAEEMSDYLNESFPDNVDDLGGLLSEYAGSYDVKVEPLPEGEI